MVPLIIHLLPSHLLSLYVHLLTSDYSIEYVLFLDGVSILEYVLNDIEKEMTLVEITWLKPLVKMTCIHPDNELLLETTCENDANAPCHIWKFERIVGLFDSDRLIIVTYLMDS